MAECTHLARSRAHLEKSRQLVSPFRHGERHPDTSGHILIAYAIIHTLGFSTVVAKSTVNARTRTVKSQTNCTVSNVTANANGGIDFDRLDYKATLDD